MKWPAAGALLALAGLTGCGSQYRPIINPIVQTGPASQPGANVAVFSQPGLLSPSTLPTNAPPCPAKNPVTGTPAAYASPGVVTVLDATGDTVQATAALGNGPLTFALDPSGGTALTENCDGTLSSVPINDALMTKDVNSSTLLPGSAPTNVLVLSTSQQYVVEQGHNAIAALSSNPPTLKLEITNVAPSVINLTGIFGAQRVYSISQGNSVNPSGSPAWGACSNPSSVSVNGEADGIEVASNSISSRIPLGVCPVYGVSSADGERAFILNRGSGTISVINVQSNQLDTVNASPYVTNGTITLPCAAGVNSCTPGPVYAEFYTPANLLVVSNYDDDTVSVIDTSLDIFGNDSATFGKVLATIPVGSHPAALTVLQDPITTRAYVANEGVLCTGANATTCTTDGSVTVVSLTSFTALDTIDLGSAIPNPRSIASNYNYPSGNVFVGAQNSEYVAVIRTDTETVSAQIQVQGNVVDLRTSSQYAAASARNSILESRSVGSGEP